MSKAAEVLRSMRATTAISYVLIPVPAEMMLGVHVQDKRRILFLQGISKDVLGCMGPLQFKPLCLAIECANLVLLFRLEASFVDLLYIPLGMSSRQTQSTCSSDAIPQYSVDESQI
nr:hypothetical protein [Tanacetum cinerariifolium]